MLCSLLGFIVNKTCFVSINNITFQVKEMYLHGWCFPFLIRVIVFDKALTWGCWIKRHFVFFSSLTLSAKTVLTEQESQEGERQTEGDRNRQKNRPDDWRADRQVEEQPVALDSTLQITGALLINTIFLSNAGGVLPVIHTWLCVLDSELRMINPHTSRVNRIG